MKGTIIDISKILLLWKGRETEFIQYHVIRDQIKGIIANSYPKGHSKNGMKVEERTIMRYLQSLVEEKKLDKKIDLDHKTYYRPVNSVVVLKEILKDQIESTIYPENATSEDVLASLEVIIQHLKLEQTKSR